MMAATNTKKSRKPLMAITYISSSAVAGPAAGQRAPDAVEASGIATLHIPFRHAVASARDAQTGPP